MRGHITPHWNAEEIYAIEYQKQENIYKGFTPVNSVRQDAETESLIEIYHGAPPIFNLAEFDKCFSWLKNKMYAVLCMNPGGALPEHFDKYLYYSKANNIDDIEQIQRIIVFLEDKKVGHRFTLDGVNILTWNAGDWVSWTGRQQHGAYNEGNENRYVLQLTGTFKQ
jgi:hypothetical protein